MSPPSRAAVLMCLMLLAVGGCASSHLGASAGGGLRAGQILFVPWAGLGQWEDPGDLKQAKLQILACEEMPGALAVRGHVDRAGVVTSVFVESSDPATAAVRVGFSDYVDRGYPDGDPGDFLVNIPWANRSTRFVLGVLASGPNQSIQVSAVAHCPNVVAGP